ncbi:MAG TPA: sulfatase-like hydrolase/transferase [Sphingomicrobium sp.]|nr:sulfatase-like hydrolase/transferase [Sphingomicrobium sp.]
MSNSTFTRRSIISALPSGALALGLGASPLARAAASIVTNKRPPNILFVFTDQERYFRQFPAGMSLPAHERLWRGGTTFTNHYISAVQCTPSRAVMATGLQTADNRMFENCDMPWVKDLDPKIPTVGRMVAKAGYYPAYKGKWHLTRKFDQEKPDRLFTTEMEAYGYNDYASPGDIVGHTLGGYEFDHLIAGSAVTWLRRRGSVLNASGKPWALTVSLVNPHDIMYFNTDSPGQNIQDSGKLLKPAARAPDIPFYKATWDVPLSSTNGQPFDSPGRPKAHGEYQAAWDHLLGHVPNEPERWKRFNDFYMNSIRAVDRELMMVLAELDTLGMSDRTIIVYTADHGEMAGAHGGLRGKGPFAYEENIHVPFVVVHPDVAGGRESKALTSAIDIVPTLLGFAGADRTKSSEFAGRDLPGKDLGPLLGEPNAALNANRDAVLFTYSGIATNDASMIGKAADFLTSGKTMKDLIASGARADLTKRGTVRTMFDGRYKFTRYLSPIERNRPTNLDDLYAHNDVELFDLSSDPNELTNLGADKGQNAELVEAMSAKLERSIAAEIGVDDGREMPDLQGQKINWALPVNAID